MVQFGTGYNAIIEACCNAWMDLIRSPDLIKSIATRARTQAT